jgi:hypothetical protein
MYLVLSIVMTGGALMQLVAYGAQDVYLTGNPTITHFKTVYRRCTNFSMESIEQFFTSGKVDFGNRLTCTIARNGDLINEIYLEVVLPSIPDIPGSANWVRWTDNIGHFIIETVSVEIGGQMIDRHYGDWLEIWSQLTVPAGHRQGYLTMIGQDRSEYDGAPTGLQLTAAQAPRIIFVPLQFWFCRNVGLSLPLISLQYHEVTIVLGLSSLDKLLITTDPTGAIQANVLPDTLIGLQASLWVNYVFLDTEERWRFAQVTHEYLIDQLQFFADETMFTQTPSKNIPLEFNQPVKEIVWVVRSGVNERFKQWCNYTNVKASSQLGPVFMKNPYGSRNPVFHAKIVLNGYDRFALRSGEYFNWVQPHSAHTNIPESPGINVYSFALQPEGHQPSGTCNFSRIDTAILNIQLTNNNTPVLPNIKAKTNEPLISPQVVDAPSIEPLRTAVANLRSLYSQSAIQPVINYVNAQPSVGQASLVLGKDGLTLADVGAFMLWTDKVQGQLNAWNKRHAAYRDDNTTQKYIHTAQMYLTAIGITDLVRYTVQLHTGVPSSGDTSFNDQLSIITQLNPPKTVSSTLSGLVNAYALIVQGTAEDTKSIMKEINAALVVIKNILLPEMNSSYYDLPKFGKVSPLGIDEFCDTIKRYTAAAVLPVQTLLKAPTPPTVATTPPLNTESVVKVYATNYNVLRIMSGMGGLVYSN